MDGHSGNNSWSTGVYFWSFLQYFLFWYLNDRTWSFCSMLSSSDAQMLKSKAFVDGFSSWTKSDFITHVLPLSGLQGFLFGQWCISVPFEVSWTESRTSPAINSVGKAGPTEHMWGQRLHLQAHCGKKKACMAHCLAKTKPQPGLDAWHTGVFRRGVGRGWK